MWLLKFYYWPHHQTLFFALESGELVLIAIPHQHTPSVVLRRFMDVDQLVSFCVQVPKRESSKSADITIGYVRTLVDQVCVPSCI